MKWIRMILGVIGIWLTIWFLIPVFSRRILNIGNLTGIVVGILLLLYGIFMPTVHRWCSAVWDKRVGKAGLSFLGIVLLAAVALLIVESGLMIHAAAQKPQKGATVVILGCKVYGEKPSRMLKGRMDAAYEYLQENEDSVCILSGGKGADEDISEAECMYRYLTDKGIDPGRLYLEDRSTSTRENLAYSLEIIKEEGLNEQIAIATNEFHEYRAGKIADSLGVSYGAVSSHTQWWLFPTYYVRELYGILYEWIVR